jgi:streptogramin lyase
MRHLLALPFILAAACQTSEPSRVAGAGASEDLPTKPTAEMPVVAQIESSGDWMCVGFGSLWEPSGGIKRIDPVEHKVITQITAAKGNFCHASPDENVMWVASAFDGKLFRIDAGTNAVTATYQVGVTSGSEGSFTVTPGGIWVITNRGEPATDSGTLTRIDPATGSVLADIRVADDSHGIASLGDFVWVTSSSGNSVTQVDVRTNEVVGTIPVDPEPRFIAAGEGAVWVLSQGSGKVNRLDPLTGEIVATIDTQTPGFGGGVAAGEGFAYVTTFGKPVTKIDVQTNRVVVQYVGDGFGDAIEAGLGYVWVSGGKLSQISP